MKPLMYLETFFLSPHLFLENLWKEWISHNLISYLYWVNSFPSYSNKVAWNKFICTSFPNPHFHHFQFTDYSKRHTAVCQGSCLSTLKGQMQSSFGIYTAPCHINYYDALKHTSLSTKINNISGWNREITYLDEKKMSSTTPLFHK